MDIQFAPSANNLYHFTLTVFPIPLRASPVPIDPGRIVTFFQSASLALCCQVCCCWAILALPSIYIYKINSYASGRDRREHKRVLFVTR